MSYIFGLLPAIPSDPAVAAFASGACRTCGHPLLFGPSLRGAYLIAWERDLTVPGPIAELDHFPYHPGCVQIEDEAAAVELLEAIAR